jgi:nucleoside permease NupC
MIYLVDACLGILLDVAERPLSLQRVLGWCMAPLVWLIGVLWGEAVAAGGLMGLKTVANERVAFYRIDPHRSKEAFEQLVQDWDGILVSDSYGLYRNGSIARLAVPT